MSALAALRPEGPRPPATGDVEAAADGTFSGYASRFRVPDLTGDVMLPGAFRASLARRGASGVKLLYQHDPTMPIGRWLAIAEDAAGLRVSGRLQLSIGKAREVFDLMRAGILDGLSIGFRTVTARTDRKSGLREVAEVDLWEVSLVTFPMLPTARVTAVGPAAPPDAPVAAAALAARLRGEAARLRP